MRTAFRLLAVAAIALSASACLSFGAKTPPVLLRLSAETPRTATAARTASAGESITVVTPAIGQELKTPRVPVRTGTTDVAYLPDAQWVEIPNALFGRLLAETISSRTGRVVLDAGQTTFDPGTRLTGTLAYFGLQADSLEAVAIYDAALARGADAVETRRFEARVPVAAIDSPSAAIGLNQAANRIAADVAAWVGG